MIHPGVSEILDDLMQNEILSMELVNHHITTFVDLYNQCSIGKEKYLRFQLDWHKHCSIFLLPKDVDVEVVLPKHSQQTRTMCQNIRNLWQQLSESYSFEK